MTFSITNPHPEGKKTGDCVVRALAVAEAKSWVEVYDELCKIGREVFEMPNSKPVYEKYLLSRGWVKQKMPKFSNGKRFKVSDLANDRKSGAMVVSVSKHLVAVVDGCIHDTWYSGQKAVFNFYTK